MSDTDSPYGDYFMAVRTGFSLSILVTRVERGRKESIDDLMGIIDGLGILSLRTG